MDKECYELGKQKICLLSFNEIEELISKFPTESPVRSYPPVIQTINATIRKVDQDLSNDDGVCCEIRYKAKKRRFLLKSKVTEKFNNLKEQDFERKEWDDLDWKEITKLVFKMASIFLFSLIVLAAYIFIFFQYLAMLNLFFIILWFWLVLLTFLDLIAAGIELFKDFRIRSPEYGILYKTPITSEFETFSFLRLFILSIISYGALTLLLSGFLLEGLENHLQGWEIYIFIILIPALSTFVILSSILILISYFKNHKLKGSMIRDLNKYLQEESITWIDKEFLIQIIIELKNKSIVSISFFSKFIMILTILLTTIPPISGLYI